MGTEMVVQGPNCQRAKGGRKVVTVGVCKFFQEEDLRTQVKPENSPCIGCYADSRYCVGCMQSGNIADDLQCLCGKCVAAQCAPETVSAEQARPVESLPEAPVPATSHSSPGTAFSVEVATEVAYLSGEIPEGVHALIGQLSSDKAKMLRLLLGIGGEPTHLMDVADDLKLALKAANRIKVAALEDLESRVPPTSNVMVRIRATLLQPVLLRRQKEDPKLAQRASSNGIPAAARSVVPQAPSSVPVTPIVVRDCEPTPRAVSPPKVVVDDEDTEELVDEDEEQAQLLVAAGDSEPYNADQFPDAVRVVIGGLEANASRVLRMRLGLCGRRYGYHEIGLEIGTSRQGVYRIQDAALALMDVASELSVATMQRVRATLASGGGRITKFHADFTPEGTRIKFVRLPEILAEQKLTREAILLLAEQLGVQPDALRVRTVVDPATVDLTAIQTDIKGFLSEVGTSHERTVEAIAQLLELVEQIATRPAPQPLPRDDRELAAVLQDGKQAQVEIKLSIEALRDAVVQFTQTLEAAIKDIKIPAPVIQQVVDPASTQLVGIIQRYEALAETQQRQIDALLQQRAETSVAKVEPTVPYDSRLSPDICRAVEDLAGNERRLMALLLGTNGPRFSQRSAQRELNITGAQLRTRQVSALTVFLQVLSNQDYLTVKGILAERPASGDVSPEAESVNAAHARPVPVPTTEEPERPESDQDLPRIGPDGSFLIGDDRMVSVTAALRELSDYRVTRQDLMNLIEQKQVRRVWGYGNKGAAIFYSLQDIRVGLKV